ncbi:hypothetical protein COAQ111491_18180 [Comamonas aquatilis]
MNDSLSFGGASAPVFAAHPGYRRMFAPDALTLGVFLPLRFYQGDMQVLDGQSELVSAIDHYGFAAVWVRDVPLFDPSFGDAGQVFDPFTYLAFLAAKTKTIALATGSAIFSLRHPIELAKASATIDQLSGGRLVLGIASGDRPVEFPAYGLEHGKRGERFAQSVTYFRQLLQQGRPVIDSPPGPHRWRRISAQAYKRRASADSHRLLRPIAALDRRACRRLADLSRAHPYAPGPSAPCRENPGLARHDS